MKFLVVRILRAKNGTWYAETTDGKILMPDNGGPTALDAAAGAMEYAQRNGMTGIQIA